jgi:hypothetical protein
MLAPILRDHGRDVIGVRAGNRNQQSKQETDVFHL